MEPGRRDLSGSERPYSRLMMSPSVTSAQPCGGSTSCPTCRGGSQDASSSPDIAKSLEVAEHDGLCFVAFGNQVFQLGHFRCDIDRLGIGAGLHVAADIEIVAV